SVSARTSAIGSMTGIAKFTDLGGNLPAGTALLLGPLTSNGGATETHKLLAGSPAIDTGSNPAGVLFDQRGTGFPRVSGVFPDIGAVEAVSAGTPVAKSSGFANVTATGGTNYVFSVTYSDDTAINVTTLDNSDIRVTGPNGFNMLATFLEV